MEKDKQISESLGKLFSRDPRRFIPTKGVHNYMKLPLEQGVAYCYIECYDQQYNIQHQLVTIIQNLDGTSEVYRNTLIFKYSNMLKSRNILDIEISIREDELSQCLAIVYFTYNYTGNVKQRRQAVIGIQIEWIIDEEELMLQELSVNNDFLQARWHPYRSHIIIGLTEKTFEIMEFDVMGIRRMRSEKFQAIGIEEDGVKITDFCFWRSSHQQKAFNIIATKVDGRLLLILCKLDYNQNGYLSPNQQQLVDTMDRFQMRFYQQMERVVDANILSIQSYSPARGVLLLFKKAVGLIRDSSPDLMMITALVELQQTYVQQPLITVQSKNLGVGFKIPYSDLIRDNFYFWYGQKLTRVNLSKHIKYLQKFFENPYKNTVPPNRIKTEIIVEVNEKTAKFVVVDISAIKVLRKQINLHNYCFTSLAIETTDLLSEEQNASKKLYQVFGEMQKRMVQLIQPKKDSSQPSFNQKLALLKDETNANPTQIEAVANSVEDYMDKVSEQLKTEENELNLLYREAEKLTDQLNYNKGKWKELYQLLNNIEKNSEVIKQKQQKLKSNNKHTATINYIEDRCKDFSKPLQLSPELRKDYFETFSYQRMTLQSLNDLIDQSGFVLQNLSDQQQSGIE